MNKDDEGMIFGIRACMEAIQAGKDIERVYIRKGLAGELSTGLLQLIKQQRIPKQEVPAEMLNRVTRKNHQGVIAYLSAIEYKNIEEIVPVLFEKGEVPLILALDGITDVRNFGAIARSAECAGVHAILVPEKGAARINADAVKTSAGALMHLPVCRTRHFLSTIKFLKESGLKLVAASEKAATMHYKADLDGPMLLIMGAEDVGISPKLLEMADEHVAIPVKGNISSLNVSAAASVILYEVLRQREG